MTPWVMSFARKYFKAEDIHSKHVLEIGALNVNGTVKNMIMNFKPARYVGTDILGGPCVDEIIDAKDIVGKFGTNSFDYVICTEVLEHIKDWKTVISNIKLVLRPYGKLILTTRSPGFEYHPFPEDHWRFTLTDMAYIFPDFIWTELEEDALEPGVGIFATKPPEWRQSRVTEQYEVERAADLSQVAEPLKLIQERRGFKYFYSGITGQNAGGIVIPDTFLGKEFIKGLSAILNICG